MTDWLDSEDGRAAIEAGAEALRKIDGTFYVEAFRDAAGVLAAALALTKPCPTCGGSGHEMVPFTHGPKNKRERDRLSIRCLACDGSGTVPLLVPKEEG